MVDQLSLMRELSIKTESKIVMLVLDGLGGLPHPDTGKTELEAAYTPNLDALAQRSICGLTDPVMPGITPGSAPGHLSLFGYNPLEHTIGRGVLEALGIDFDLRDGDIAARGNLCTIDRNGIITDRRAGRVTTDKSANLAALLNGMKINGVEVLVEPVKDHRLAVVFRGEGLSDLVTDSDPQRIGLSPSQIEPKIGNADRMAYVANKFIDKATELLIGQYPANGLLLRGFSHKSKFHGFKEVYKLDACAIASYPMYRGLARVVGMTVVKTGLTILDEITSLQNNYDKYDYFFLHYKPTDTAGEDGDFAHKVKMLEYFDQLLPQLTALRPDVLLVTGDHSTPSLLSGHSWHPVPAMISGRFCRPDGVVAFNETACLSGGLGRLPAYHLMPLVMANAMKLGKYGA